ncbi:response regulator [Paraburkholderia dipogonis]|uniref:response regulator n=1 Tax=Paraburkholderia dipogonis TaxID=1211383 RepID=UPI0038B8D539
MSKRLVTDENSSASKMQTILLGDDDRSILIAWTHILQPEAYRVEAASDGAAGLVATNKVQPILIITDGSMSGMNGSSSAVNSGTSQNWQRSRWF